MMRVIFDRETEIGKCDFALAGDHFQYAEPHFSTMYAHTQASLNNRGLLKIEQHCYLRNGANLPDQPWVRPQIVLEPAIGSEAEMIELAETMHQQFVQRTQRQFPQGQMA